MSKRKQRTLRWAIIIIIVCGIITIIMRNLSWFVTFAVASILSYYFGYKTAQEDEAKETEEVENAEEIEKSKKVEDSNFSESH